MHKFVTAFLIAASSTALTAAEPTPAPAPAPASALPSGPFTEADAKAVIPALAAALEENYVFPETGKRYADAIRARFAAGAYKQFANNVEFAKAVTIDMPSRLLSAFPPGVRVSRVPLDVAVDRVKQRLGATVEEKNACEA